ncbi:MAG: biosynthetic arginine decarboxylase [Candidatus Protochlamydia sp.]|nr:biosynthetic arginine decarboxylase [Candidatus Protochlamydia sp.]
MQKKDFYGIDRWSEGYFDVNSMGHAMVKPNRQGSGGDLYELMKSLVAQGIDAPILIRFNGIIRDRIEMLNTAFQAAIHEFKYRNTYQIVYPVKVNPQRHVVETVKAAGQKHRMGLEVGSKPELIAVLPLEDNQETLLLCNGYKDAEYISLALMSLKLGRRTIIIIEQIYELNLVLEAAEKLGIEAQIGFRMKLSSTGSGRWKSSGGAHSKFGLFTHEIISCLDALKAKNKTDWVKLLHFHIGSQITTIESIKKALKEGSRMYSELAPLLPNLSIFDVGGGLGVDYDGSRSISDSSMNYTVEEYARDVVSAIGEACLESGIPDPLIITESGRAIVAHHSVLITEVIDVTAVPESNSIEKKQDDHEILQTLYELDKKLTLDNCREAFHDLMELKEQILEEFIYGKLSVRERGYAEKMSQYLFVKVRHLYQQLPKIPNEISILNQILLETYFCNFSVFQSLPDSWAIGHLFPIIPIQKLNEEPDHQAILADLTCDSDGIIDTFINNQEASSFINLHDYGKEPYYMGIFLAGAYQEILGGLHNLFGDTNVVHAELGTNDQWELSNLVEGDTIEEVLHYIQYNKEKLMGQLHDLIEYSIKIKRISLTESGQIKKAFKNSLESYTYLVV